MCDRAFYLVILLHDIDSEPAVIDILAQLSGYVN